MTVEHILRLLEAKAPARSAEEWDNVGLLVGDPKWRTKGAVVSVDLTREALDLAAKKGLRLVINHHACIFPKSKGLSRVTAGAHPTAPALVFEAVRRGIAVIACHTNFDRCGLEAVEAVAAALGARPVGRLFDKTAGSLVKLAVFVPKGHVEKVRLALCEAGAGAIGEYDSCTFGTDGEGTFRGGAGTHPFLGRPGKLERAREVRLETLVPKGLTDDVLHAMIQAHPYEEVAYDLYPVEQGPLPRGITRGLGTGFWGELERPTSWGELSRRISKTFDVEGFRLTGGAPRASEKIRRIAWSPGEGSSFVSSVVSAGCDVFVTGEIGYHYAIDAARRGTRVIELGHRESERFFAPTVGRWLRNAGYTAHGLNRPIRLKS